jgi:hypothetical protein
MVGEAREVGKRKPACFFTLLAVDWIAAGDRCVAMEKSGALPSGKALINRQHDKKGKMTWLSV